MPKSASDKRHFIVVGALVAVSTFVMYLLLDAFLPLPVQASLEAIAIDGLINSHLIIIAFLFSLIVVFMLYAVVVFRVRPNDDPQAEGEHFEGNTTLEIAWTVLPLILVVVFSFYGINVLAEVVRPGENEFEVTAVGRQWSWTFEYPNGVISPELVMPVNQDAYVTLRSPDVLHSFWIPEMRVKQDLVPGQDTHIRFTPIVAGEYKVRCAEICGLSHWSMENVVRVVEPTEYDAWMAEQAAAQGVEVAQAGQ
jgi:cytochrome c oxidase subunit 2